MLFWIWIILIALAIVGWFLCYRFDKCGEYDWTWIVSLIIGIIGVFAASIFLIVNNVGISGKVAELQTRHDILVYQYENNVYDNDNDLGKRELIVDIQEWNEDLSWYQANQRDFWIGIFIPNVYDRFEFIELGDGDNDG